MIHSLPLYYIYSAVFTHNGTNLSNGRHLPRYNPPSWPTVCRTGLTYLRPGGEGERGAGLVCTEGIQVADPNLLRL